MMPVITICRVLFSLKKVYQTYQCQFLVTGEGVKEDDNAINLTGEFSVYLSRTSSVPSKQRKSRRNGLSTMTCMTFGLNCQTTTLLVLQTPALDRILQPRLLQCFPSAVARQTVVALRTITLILMRKMTKLRLPGHMMQIPATVTALSLMNRVDGGEPGDGSLSLRRRKMMSKARNLNLRKLQYVSIVDIIIIFY